MYQAIGNLLDLPGSTVRDALSGHNPFDQFLDPFGSSNRTSGADMLSSMGVSGEDHPLIAALLEMGLDPTTYVGAGLAKGAIKGGLSAVGKGAKAVRGMKTASQARSTISAGFKAASKGFKDAVKAPFSRTRTVQKISSLAPFPDGVAGLPSYAFPTQVTIGPGTARMALQNLATNATNAAYNPAIRNPVLGALMINAAQSARNERPFTPEEEAYLYQ